MRAVSSKIFLTEPRCYQSEDYCVLMHELLMRFSSHLAIRENYVDTLLDFKEENGRLSTADLQYKKRALHVSPHDPI